MIEIENANQLIKFLNKSGYNSRVLESNDQLYKMLFKSEKVPYTNLSADFNKKIDELSNFNIILKDSDGFNSTIRIVPFKNYWFIVDSQVVAATQPGGLNNYYSNNLGTYGYLGDDGLMLIRHILSKNKNITFKKGLDICTGSGLIGISLSSMCDYIYGVDIDETAIKWANFNTLLNNVKNYKPMLGDLYGPAMNEGPFDLITANPSYSFYSPEFISKYKVRKHEMAEDYGCELVFKIIDGLNNNLTKDGVCHIITCVPVIKGEDYFVEKLNELFSSTNFNFTINYNLKIIPAMCQEYYKELRISHFEFVFIDVKKGEQFQIIKKNTMHYYIGYFRFLKNIKILRKIYRYLWK